jgi:hypothetical protein
MDRPEKHEPVCLWAALQHCRVACCARACVVLCAVFCGTRRENGTAVRSGGGQGVVTDGSEWADGRDGTGFSFRWMSLLLLAVVVVV